MRRRRAEASELLCPGCGTRPPAHQPAQERFCAACGMPLVIDRVPPAPNPRQEWARKIKPQLAEGTLVRVAGARNQAEAEFIQALLLEEGVPSLLRRSAGFDVPDFLAAGPRDVLVPQSGVSSAREILLEAELISEREPRTALHPGRLLAGLLLALTAGVLVVWVLLHAVG